MLNYVLFGLIGAVVALILYVRLAPLNESEWHAITLPVGPVGEMTAAGNHTVLRAVVDAQDTLTRLDAIIKATPRTTRVAGSVETGRMTYVTRSRLMGFPDYTTIAVTPVDSGGATLAIFGRLRFGQADMGVNKARISGWLAQLDEAQS